MEKNRIIGEELDSQESSLNQDGRRKFFSFKLLLIFLLLFVASFIGVVATISALSYKSGMDSPFDNLVNFLWMLLIISVALVIIPAAALLVEYSNASRIFTGVASLILGSVVIPTYQFFQGSSETFFSWGGIYPFLAIILEISKVGVLLLGIAVIAVTPVEPALKR